MKFLIGTVETWRADTESEAKALIEEARRSGNVSKYSSEYKEQKSKGEVVDAYYKVTITRALDNIKEPTNSVVITYGEESAF